MGSAASNLIQQPNPALAPIRAWLEGRMGEPALLHDDLDVFESKVVDSLSFVEYVLVIEDAIGTELVADDTLVDKVRSLRRIAESFA